MSLFVSGTATPTFYALALTRGLDLELVRVVSGVSTTLADLKSTGWLDGQWVTASLTVSGTMLTAQVG